MTTTHSVAGLRRPHSSGVLRVATATVVLAALAVSAPQAVSAVTISVTQSSPSPSPSALRTVKKILHFSDVHLNISQSLNATESATFVARYGQDTTVGLLESALAYAQHVLPHPDFFLYTGDHVAHGDFPDAYVAKALETNVQMIEKYFPPHADGTLETTAILGNADANPDYYMEITNPMTHVNPSIAKVSHAWGASLTTEDFDTFNRRGYLTYELDTQLHVLTLNTVPYSPSHKPDTSNIADPFGQFAWLNATLAALQQTNKFAFIAGHIAPIIDSYGGQPQWHPHYIATYKAIVARYATVVKAQVFGHVHSVEVRVSPAPVDGIAGIAGSSSLDAVPLFVSGAISPLFLNNPSFMVWEYDAVTFDMLDFTVYGTSLAPLKNDNATTTTTKANEPFVWTQLFRASTAYGLKSLAAADVRDLYARLEASPSLLETYYWNMKAQAHNVPACSTDSCRAKTLCSLKWWTTTGEYVACVDGVMTTAALVAARTPTNGTSSSSSRTTSKALLAPSDVWGALFLTLLTTGVVVAVVLSVLRGLRRSGVINPIALRNSSEKDDLFPML